MTSGYNKEDYEFKNRHKYPHLKNNVKLNNPILI
jgi:hypothetical protein